MTDVAPGHATDDAPARPGGAGPPAGAPIGRAAVRPQVRRCVALLATVVAVVGHVWIIAIGAANTSLWLFAPVALALAVRAVALPLRLHEGWRDPPPMPPRIDQTAALPVDIVVTTVGDPAEHLLETLVSCLALRGDVRVLVADDGTDGAAELAAELGVAHRRRADRSGARAANVNDALRVLTDLPGRPLPAEAVLLLAAGQVVLPDLLERCLLPLAQDGVAVVEPGATVLDPEGPSEVGDLGRVATWRRTVVAPGLSTAGAGTWWGDAPALVRRSALLAAGGLATGTLTPELPTGIHLQRLGWRIVTVPGVHARVRRPHDPDALVATRERRSVDRLTAILDERAFADRRLTGHQRLSYFALLWQAVRSMTTLLAVVLTITALVSGVPFIVLDRSDLLWPGLGAATAEAVAVLAVGRGLLRPLDVVRHDLRTSTSAPAALLRAARRRPPTPQRIARQGDNPGGLRSAGAHAHLVWIVLALEGAVLWPLARANLDLPGPGARGLVLFVGMALAVVFVVAATTALTADVTARQRRWRTRAPTELRATVDGVPVAVIDTTSSGLGIAAPVSLRPGRHVDVQLAIPRLGAGPLLVRSRASVRHQHVVADARLRHIGVELEDATAATRRALATYRAVVHPFAELGRAEEPEAAAAPPPAPAAAPSPSGTPDQRGVVTQP